MTDANSAPTAAPAVAAPPDRTAAEPLRWGWGDLLALLLIFVVAVTLRLVYAHQVQANPAFANPTMDPLYHHEWAQNIVAGKPLEGPYFRAPLYPWFLAGIYKTLGVEPMTPRIVQAVLGAINCCLVYVIGRLAFGALTAAIAGLTAASYWPLLYFDAELLLPVLEIFFFQGVIIALLLAHRTRGMFWWLLAGLLLGAGALVRPNILILAPAVIVWLALLERERLARLLPAVALFVLGVFAPILPVTIRNYVVGKDTVLIASQGGVNFYIGNNAGSDGMSALIPGDPGGWWEGYRAQVARAEQAVGRPLKASEVSQWYTSEALDFMTSQPAVALNLLVKKLGYFWTYWEIANNQDIMFTVREFAPITRWLPHGFWLIGPLGVLGLLLCFARPAALFPIWGYVLLYMVSVVAFFVTARFRLPVAIILILLAAHAVVWLCRQIRRNQWLAVGLAAFPLTAMGFVTAQLPPGTDTSGAQGNLFAAMQLTKDGKFAEAEAMLLRVAPLDRAMSKELRVNLWTSLAYCQQQLNKLPDAANSFRKLLEADPAFPGARRSLGALLAVTGDVNGAMEQYKLALQSNPQDAETHLNLGATLVRIGRIGEALRAFDQALQLKPDLVPQVVDSAGVLARAGRFPDAAAVLHGVQQRVPDHPNVLTMLTQVLVASGDPSVVPRAVEAADAALRIRPDDGATMLAAAQAYLAAGDVARAKELGERGLQRAKQRNLPALANALEALLRRAATQPASVPAESP